MVQYNEHMPAKLDRYFTFMTPTSLKIISIFIEDPMNEHHEREVMRMSKVSKGSANKILNQLAALSLLLRKQKGRMVFYKLNMQNSAVRQLKILLNVWKLRLLVERIKEFSRKIILFGSCAEGTDVKESDIDIFILADEKAHIKSIISRYNAKNMQKISPIILDSNELTDMKRNDKPLYERIERGIVLWKAE